MQSTLHSNRKILLYAPDCERFGGLYTFGPNFRPIVDPFIHNTKEKVVEHVLFHSGSSLETIKDIISTIEQEARAAYDDAKVKDLDEPAFQQMMVFDGCFFVAMVFSLLGAGKELKFSKDDPFFNAGYVIHHTNNWLQSIFIVGNQVPSIVIDKLMELSLFKNVRETLKCKQQQQGLGKRTLHEFLIVDQNPRPMDLIHCLQSVMLGPKGGPNTAAGKKDNGIEETVSAARLSKQGIKFEKLKGGLGIRAVDYKCNTFFGAVLSLPILNVDGNTEMLINCLLKYEAVQELEGVECGARSFFKFMCELIRTSKDVKVLESEGIIEGRSKSLLAILGSLEAMVSSADMHSVKGQIIGNPPLQWKKPLKWIFGCTTLLFLLAFIQLLYGMLSFYKGRKH